MSRSLAVESLSVRAFRNLTTVDIDLGPGFNVVSGDNGQGKTNLLEALYVVASSRSFRTTKLADLVELPSAGNVSPEAGVTGRTATVRASVREDGLVRSQSVGVRAGLRAVRIDGQLVAPLAAYAVRTPTVVFHPGAVALSSGTGAERRRLLDRLALYLWPSSLGDSMGYVKAARSRQRVLTVRGCSAADLDGWEDLMVQHGMRLSEARSRAAAQLGPAAERAFSRIGPAQVKLTARYARSAPDSTEEFRMALASRRTRDRSRGSAHIGPHRDDLALDLGGRSVRGSASQGQHRAVVLALELAEIDVVADARGVRPILLLDDVSSELDSARNAALFEALHEDHGQVLVTTTRPELVGAGGSLSPGRRDFTVVAGTIRPA